MQENIATKIVENRTACNWALLASSPGECSRHLILSDCKDVINASAFAAEQGKPHLVMVTIRWDMSAPFVVRDWLHHQGRLFDKITRWLLRNGIAVSFTWVREMGRQNGPHTHLLLHLPFEYWGEFTQFTLKAGEFETANQTGTALTLRGGSFGAMKATMRAGALLYALKCVDPKAVVRAPAAEGGTRSLATALGIRPDLGCLPVSGKRVGSSHAIGGDMRRYFGWKTLHSAAELHAYLHPLKGT